MYRVYGTLLGQMQVVYLQLEMCGWTRENIAALNVPGFCLSVHVGLISMCLGTFLLGFSLYGTHCASST